MADSIRETHGARASEAVMAAGGWVALGCSGLPSPRSVICMDNLDRDVDLYHWSSAKFESTWRDTLSVLAARGRAQVGVHSAKTDWSRRILDFQYMDYDDQAAHHA